MKKKFSPRKARTEVASPLTSPPTAAAATTASRYSDAAERARPCENGRAKNAELRLVVGPLPDVEAAARLCANLSAIRRYCQPVAFEGQRFDYLLANPPFGVEWKKVADTVRREHGKLGFGGRVGDGKVNRLAGFRHLVHLPLGVIIQYGGDDPILDHNGDDAPEQFKTGPGPTRPPG